MLAIYRVVLLWIVWKIGFSLNLNGYFQYSGLNTVYQCSVKNACTISSSVSSCNVGYTGRLCDQCDEGYLFDYLTQRCLITEESSIALWFLWSFILTAGFLAMFVMGNHSSIGSTTKHLGFLAKHAFVYLKIVSILPHIMHISLEKVKFSSFLLRLTGSWILFPGLYGICFRAGQYSLISTLGGLIFVITCGAVFQYILRAWLPSIKANTMNLLYQNIFNVSMFMCIVTILLFIGEAMSGVAGCVELPVSLHPNTTEVDTMFYLRSDTEIVCGGYRNIWASSQLRTTHHVNRSPGSPQGAYLYLQLSSIALFCLVLGALKFGVFNEERIGDNDTHGSTKNLFHFGANPPTKCRKGRLMRRKWDTSVTSSYTTVTSTCSGVSTASRASAGSDFGIKKPKVPGMSAFLSKGFTTNDLPVFRAGYECWEKVIMLYYIILILLLSSMNGFSSGNGGGSVLQCALGVVMTVLFITSLLYLQPFNDRLLSGIYLSFSVILLTTMILLQLMHNMQMLEEIYNVIINSSVGCEVTSAVRVMISDATGLLSEPLGSCSVSDGITLGYGIIDGLLFVVLCLIPFLCAAVYMLYILNEKNISTEKNEVRQSIADGKSVTIAHTETFLTRGSNRTMPCVWESYKSSGSKRSRDDEVTAVYVGDSSGIEYGDRYSSRWRDYWDVEQASEIRSEYGMSTCGRFGYSIGYGPSSVQSDDGIYRRGWRGSDNGYNNSKGGTALSVHSDDGIYRRGWRGSDSGYNNYNDDWDLEQPVSVHSDYAASGPASMRFDFTHERLPFGCQYSHSRRYDNWESECCDSFKKSTDFVTMNDATPIAAISNSDCEFSRVEFQVVTEAVPLDSLVSETIIYPVIETVVVKPIEIAEPVEKILIDLHEFTLKRTDSHSSMCNMERGSTSNSDIEEFEIQVYEHEQLKYDTDDAALSWELELTNECTR